MNLKDCKPGMRVQVGGRFLLTELSVLATVIDTRPAPQQPEDNPAYPNGMVQLRFDESTRWPWREPWIGPEDLALAPEVVE